MFHTLKDFSLHEVTYQLLSTLPYKVDWEMMKEFLVTYNMFHIVGNSLSGVYHNLPRMIWRFRRVKNGF